MPRHFAVDQLQPAGTLGEIFDLLFARFRQRRTRPSRTDVLLIVMVVAEQLGGRTVYLPHGALVRERLRDHLGGKQPFARSESDVPAVLKLFDAARAHFVRSCAAAPEEDAIQIAALIGDLLGGRATYIPRGDRLREALRNLQICRDFDGHNLAELAQLYALSDVQIRTILKQHRERQAATQQRGVA
jgi:Mor family transcriptional regulator